MFSFLCSVLYSIIAVFTVLPQKILIYKVQWFSNKFQHFGRITKL